MREYIPAIDRLHLLNFWIFPYTVHFYSCLPGTRVSPHVQSGISCWAAEGSMVSHWYNTGNCRRTTWTCGQWLLLSQRKWDQTWLLFTVPETPWGYRTLSYQQKGFWPLWSPWNSQGLYYTSRLGWLLHTSFYLRGSMPLAQLTLPQSPPKWWVNLQSVMHD